ncbi:response regulator [Bdellovibrio reynosensis]|uniref:Response regulator n=1 Tax=Bdellovibrio reynosensis TaxID=2835041 RepID=A0ABY4C9H2_9BACT|nr:response regulator [Bdellovibrio reynosensis]UOF01595.1 response regulator [Bdellovibrio reynosensis]
MQQAEIKKRQLENKKILVVDDNIDNQRLMSRMLQLAGAVTAVAKDGEEGVEKALHENFDAILMDLQMPVKNGLDATSELRSQSYQKPIIAVTAHGKGDKERCMEIGFSDFLEKPLEKDFLIKSVLKVLA